MRPANLLHLYRIRLRARFLQECLALVGLVAGVALLFASQIASESLSSSVRQLSQGIAGRATLQLLARDAHGVDARLLGRVRALDGVQVAAPILEADGNALGPKGARSVELVGADSSLRQLGGTLLHRTRLAPFGGIGAIVMPAPTARAIGVTRFGQEASLEVNGRLTRAPLYSQLSEAQIGVLIGSPLVVAPLAYAQEIAGLSGRVTRILIVAARGRQAAVRTALVRLAGGRMNVESTSYDEALFAKAAAASSQSTVLFAVISALVGFLFAFNAMLITVPQRRRLIAELRDEGYSPVAAMGVLLLDAVLLGTLGVALGLVLGDELSMHVLRPGSGFLASAFALDSTRVVSARSIALAAGGGMLASVLAALSPLRRTLWRSPTARMPRFPRPRNAILWWTGGSSTVCLLACTVILLAAPQLAVLGMVCLIFALLALLALALEAALALAGRVARAFVSAVPHVAVMELRASRGRSIAVAATGALAVFGSVAIQGARGDLQRGLDGAAREMNAFTDLWISPSGSFDLLMTQPFPATALARLRRLPDVRAVREYRGGLLDWGVRRTWVIAPPPDANPLIPAGQLVQGEPSNATRRLRQGGWAVLSRTLAGEHGLHIGEAFRLPAPRPITLRLAAISTNVGWAPGAVMLGSRDFAEAWESQDPSAYTVLLRGGAPRDLARREIVGALGGGSGLTVQSAAHHAARQSAVAREGLQVLARIASLVLAASVLAMAAAIGALIWQRRPRLAKLKLEGFSQHELWLMIVAESVLLLGVGCLTGAALGLLGQQLLDRALSNVVDYPVMRSLAWDSALSSAGIVVAAAAAIAALPGQRAARVPAALALRET